MRFPYLPILEILVSTIRPKSSAPLPQPDTRCDECSHSLPLEPVVSLGKYQRRAQIQLALRADCGVAPRASRTV